MVWSLIMNEAAERAPLTPIEINSRALEVQLRLPLPFAAACDPVAAILVAL
jgi:hypothetical protein